MNAETSDEELMTSIAAGNHEAFAILSDRYINKAVSFCARMVHSRELAEDVVQEAFTKLWCNAGAWRPTAQFNTWFFTVLHNASLNVIRRQKTRGETELEDVHFSSDAPPDEQLLSQEKKRHVASALACLPERQKSAVILSYYEGFSQRDAARIMGVSEGAFESLLSRARAGLKTKLQPLMEMRGHG